MGNDVVGTLGHLLPHFVGHRLSSHFDATATMSLVMSTGKFEWIIFS